MAKFRKKPVVVEAEQYSQERHTREGHLPPGAYPRHVAQEDGSSHEGMPAVRTMYGDEIVLEDGDWVILEGGGNRARLCRPDMFEEAYEPVEETEE